jgi:alkylation response protein AidB-like acyl-CoA dehydrogenase
MDWTDNPEQAAFRAEVQALIRDRLPGRYRELTKHDYQESNYTWQLDRKAPQEERRAAAAEWLDALASKNWVAPHWPQEYGGGGLSSMEQFILNAELAEAGAPPAGSNVGLGMLGPALIVHGTPEQKSRFLPPILSGEAVWAQGFSEPGAGSDLASLQTRAIRDGDDYVVNGQKIWTTHAHYADWMMVLARTDTSAPKHRGITFLLVDITSPGISMRPLIDAGWGHDINEEFFEDVRVPAQQIVGEENRGWYAAMTLLDNERSNITGAIRILGTEEGSKKGRLAQLPSLRTQVVDRYVEAAVLTNFSFRIISIQAAGQVPNHEASIAKLFGSEAAQRLEYTLFSMFGLYSNIWDHTDPRAPMEATPSHGVVESIPATIAGGSGEVQRNVIATRGLGLPRG